MADRLLLTLFHFGAFCIIAFRWEGPMKLYVRLLPDKDLPELIRRCQEVKRG